ncbi:hypothetical protein MMC31_003935 [Peltigera leucophlebia]|nr:hypothetical protein [Peltigera leucophlebia]
MTLTDENFTDNDGHEGGGSENGTGWDPSGEKSKAPEAELEFSPGKKNPKKGADASHSRYGSELRHFPCLAKNTKLILGLVCRCLLGFVAYSFGLISFFSPPGRPLSGEIKYQLLGEAGHFSQGFRVFHPY